MLLQDILTESSQHILYHLTSVDSAVSIISSRAFKLTPVAGGKDITKVSDIDNINIDTDASHYVLCTARSMTSAFMRSMVYLNGVVLTLDGITLSHHNKIKPHVDFDARSEMGSNYDEMEERIFSKTPTLNMRGPVNRTIMCVHFVDTEDEKIRSKVTNDYQRTKISIYAVQQLKKLCAANNIPMKMYENEEQLRGLR